MRSIPPLDTSTPEGWPLTGEARHALLLAGVEAGRQEQATIGTDHVMLALLDIPGTFVSDILLLQAVSAESIRGAVAPLKAPNEAFPKAQRLSREVQRALNYAARETYRLGYHYIAPEHLLMGLLWPAFDRDLIVRNSISRGLGLRDSASARSESTADTLRALGLHFYQIRVHVRGLYRSSRELFAHFTEPARRALVIARTEAKSLGNGRMGTGHLLLGLLADEDGSVAHLMREIGVPVPDLRQKICRMNVTDNEVATSKPAFTVRATEAFTNALKYAHSQGHLYVLPEHLLLAILWGEEEFSKNALRLLGVRPRENDVALEAAKTCCVNWESARQSLWSKVASKCPLPSSDIRWRQCLVAGCAAVLFLYYLMMVLSR